MKSHQKKIVLALTSNLSACVLSTNAVRPADLAPAEPPSATPEGPARWFLRFGATGVIDQSSSRLFAQSVVSVVVPGVGSVPVAGIGPDLPLPGRGASYSNLVTLGVEGGYLVTPNWSLDVSTGIPRWSTLKITGSSTTPPFSGTVLASLLLTTIPVTIDYHFTQFGQLQPYLGGGIAPSFSLGAKDRFNTGVSFSPAVGIVLQGGFDYMLNQNWGAFFDAKKAFIRSEGKSTGVNFGPPVGAIPASSEITTHFQPWLLSAGLTWRF